MNNLVAVLCFRADGIGRCLYTEAIDLACLGRLRIERATTIEYDNTDQTWRVRDMNGTDLYSSKSREDCLRWESEYFNNETGKE